MKLYKEFKEFAIKGNMIDMAVGIIIGSAFNEVVQSLVKKILLPPLSLMTEGLHIAEKKWVLREALLLSNGTEVQEISMGYGQFIEVTIDFLIMGLCVFMVIKLMNKIRNKSEDPQNKEEQTPKDIELLHDLKVLMREQNDLLMQQQKKSTP